MRRIWLLSLPLLFGCAHNRGRGDIYAELRRENAGVFDADPTELSEVEDAQIDARFARYEAIAKTLDERRAVADAKVRTLERVVERKREMLRKVRELLKEKRRIAPPPAPLGSTIEGFVLISLVDANFASTVELCCYLGSDPLARRWFHPTPLS